MITKHPEQQTLSAAATARILGVHSLTVHRMIEKGDLEATKRGGQWYIPIPAVEEITKQTIQPATATA